jgi:hypothetical protein
MTVPTNPEGLHSEIPSADETSPTRMRMARRRGLVAAGVAAIGICVVVLVLVFPALAAPIGTSAGVVAVAVPLVQRVGRGGSSGGRGADEP